MDFLREIFFRQKNEFFKNFEISKYFQKQNHVQFWIENAKNGENG